MSDYQYIQRPAPFFNLHTDPEDIKRRVANLHK